MTATKRVAFSLDYWWVSTYLWLRTVHIVVYKVLLQSVMQLTPKCFSNSYFNSFFSCHSFCCNKMFVFFLSVSRLYFSLYDFCLAGVTARFLLIFKYILITYYQTNKQMKTGGKNNSCVTIEWKVFWLSCDARLVMTLMGHMLKLNF